MILGILAAFGWMGMTYLMRTAALKEKARDYIAASRVLGASTPRILFKHLLPNSVAIVVTLIPFSVSGLVLVADLARLPRLRPAAEVRDLGEAAARRAGEPVIALAGDLGVPGAGGAADPGDLRRRGGARGVRSEEIHLLSIRCAFLIPLLALGLFCGCAEKEEGVSKRARLRRVRAEVQPLHRGRGWRSSRSEKADEDAGGTVAGEVRRPRPDEEREEGDRGEELARGRERQVERLELPAGAG